MVVGHFAGGNLAVFVGVEVVKDRLGVLGRGLVPRIGRGTGLGWSCGFGRRGVADGALRNRRL